MRRMTETLKWRDQWFRGLTVPGKLLWQYMCDNCDCAGFWRVDVPLASFETGMKVADITAALMETSPGYDAKDGTVWLIRFLEIQKCLPLSESCPAHRPIIARLQAMADFSPNIKRVLSGDKPEKGNGTLSLGLANPTGIGIGKGKGSLKRGSGGETGEFERYGELKKVRLTAAEYARLLEANGEPKLTLAIEILDTYIASKGKKYDSHYAVLKKDSWVWREVAKRDNSTEATTQTLNATEQAYAIEYHATLHRSHLTSDVERLEAKIRDTLGKDSLRHIRQAARAMKGVAA